MVKKQKRSKRSKIETATMSERHMEKKSIKYFKMIDINMIPHD